MEKQLTAIARNDFETLATKLELLREDAEKYYYKKNKSAGVRLRKNLLEISRDSHALRQSLSGINIEKYCSQEKEA